VLHHQLRVEACRLLAVELHPLHQLRLNPVEINPIYPKDKNRELDKDSNSVAATIRPLAKYEFDVFLFNLVRYYFLYLKLNASRPRNRKHVAVVVLASIR
jgi:hypothetical protein